MRIIKKLKEKIIKNRRWFGKVLKYSHLNIIPETELPDDWNELNIKNYSIEAAYYSSVLDKKLDSLVRASHPIIKNKLADVSNDSQSASQLHILDVGGGDGRRILQIKQSLSKTPQKIIITHSIDLSKDMNSIAQSKGVDKVVCDDMTKGIISLKQKMDLIFFLSGDLGFIMDKRPKVSQSKRIKSIKESYRKLKTNGRLVFELICLDENESKKGVVFDYGRILGYAVPFLGKILPLQKTTKINHYLRGFSPNEIIPLFKSAGIKSKQIEIYKKTDMMDRFEKIERLPASFKRRNWLLLIIKK